MASNYSSPVPRHIACGWYHSILYSENGFYGFGVGRHGELGHEVGFVKFKAQKLKFEIQDIKQRAMTQVAVGAKHTLILFDGMVYSTGSMEHGRLGHSRPHGIIHFPGDARMSFIACGADRSVAIDESGYNLYTWGLTGPYGSGVPVVSSPMGDQPEILSPHLFHIFDPRTLEKKRVIQVSCGSRHTIALCDDGDVFTWGFGKHGRLGHGGIADCEQPRIVQKFIVSPEQRIIQVCAGDSHSMALNQEGRVFTWGSGSYGRLGLGAELDQYVPTVVEGALKEQQVLSIHCNTFHSLAVTSGALYTWGDGKYGKLGLGNEKNQLIPQAVRGTGKVIRAVCGLHHTLAVCQDSTVYSWGYAASFRCGVQAETTALLEPTKINFFDEKGVCKNFKERVYKPRRKYKARQVSTGEAHNLALCADGTVLAWGSNAHGQLGTGYQTLSARPIPVSIGQRETFIKQVACGGSFSVALTSKGDVYTWGNNDFGQLGLGDTTSRYEPDLVKALQGTVIHSIAAGYAHTAAVEYAGYIAKKQDRERGEVNEHGYERNKLYMWGSNQHGQLGIGRNKSMKQQYPVSLKLRDSFDKLEVALGRYHTMILGKIYENGDIDDIVESRLYTCGIGEWGQLGQLTDLHTPVWEPRLVDIWEVPKRRNSDDDDSEADSDSDEDDEEGKTQTEDRAPSGGYPLITSIAAGERCSIAVCAHAFIDKLFVWGMAPGLFRSSQLLPKMVRWFESPKLPQELGIKKPISHLSIKQVVAAKSHTLVVVEIDQEKSNVVFAWGQLKYGKLGIGNVPEFFEDKKQRKEQEGGIYRPIQYAEEREEKEREGQSGGNNGNKEVTVEYLGPTLLLHLKMKNVTQVSAMADHSLAVSEHSGMVYAWGYGESGRLGLGDGTSDAYLNASEPEPTEIPGFSSAMTGGGAGLGAAANNQIAAAAAAAGVQQDNSSSNLLASLKASPSDGVKPGARADDGIGLGLGSSSAVAAMNASSSGATGTGTGTGTTLATTGTTSSAAFPAQMDEQAVRIAMSKHTNLQMKNQIQELLTPLTNTYLSKFAEYTELRKELERQKDLFHSVIVTRVDESQGAANSLTSIARAKIAKQAKAEKKKRQAQAQQKEEKKEEIEMASIALLSDDDNNHSKHHRDQLLNHSSMLTPIEECISRLYMRPCYMYKLFNLYLVQVRHAIAEQNGPKSTRLIEEFTSLLYSIYDTHQEKDLRLIHVFLRAVLHKHIVTLANPEDLLASNSLEWAVFVRYFKEGRIRRQLADILQAAVTEVGAFEAGQEPATLFDRFLGSSNLDDIRKALATIREQSNSIIKVLLSDKTFQSLMQIMSVPLEILYSACVRGKPGWQPVFGKRIISIISECLQNDLPFQVNRQMLGLARRQKRQDAGKRRGGARARAREDERGDSNNAASGGSSHDGKLSWLSGRKVDVNLDSVVQRDLDRQITSLRFVFFQLQSEHLLKQHICEKYKLPERTVESADHGHVRRTGRNAGLDRQQDPEKLKAFELYLKTIAKDRESFDPYLGVYDTDRVSAERDLYKDYLDLRTRFRRRVVVIPVSALKFILLHKAELVPSLEEHKKHDWEHAIDHHYELARVPFRLDSFHVDWQRAPIKCADCGFTHPESPELKSRTRVGGNDEIIGSQVSEHRFATDDLLDLWTILQQPLFTSVIRSAVGDEAWKKLDIQLQKKAYDTQDSREATTAANALHIFTGLRQLKERLDDSYVFFGDHTSQSVRADSLHPTLLYQILNELSIKQQSDLMMEQYKGNVIQNGIEMLNDEIHITIQTIATLKREFQFISQAYCMGDFLREVDSKNPTAERTRARVQNKLKHFGAIKVFQEKGVVTELTYNILLKKKILLPIEGFKPSIGVTWCLPVGVKEQKQFVSTLRFMFITTSSPDLIEFKLTRHTRAEGSGKRSDLLLHGEFSLRDLASDHPTCHIYKYDPTGDRVSIQREQTIEFDPPHLLAFLKQLPRPRHNLGSGDELGQSIYTVKQPKSNVASPNALSIPSGTASPGAATTPISDGRRSLTPSMATQKTRIRLL